MSLQQAIKDFEKAKKDAITNIPDRNIMPLFRLAEDEKGLFKGNGFFIDNKGNLSFQYSTNGWNVDATPSEVQKAYQLFHREYSQEEASQNVTHAIYSGLKKFYDIDLN